MAVAVYAAALRGPFVLDDIPGIVRNPTLASWAAAWRPPADSTVTGRPVLNVSFALDRALGGYSVFGYHALNVAIHAAAALALFGLVRRTAAARARGWGAAAAVPAAFAAALLWALHPLQTEAVTYVSERAESLMGLFYLLTVYAFVRAVAIGSVDERRGAGGGSRAAGGRTGDARWLAISAAACLLGMGTKEVMATAPLLVLLYDRTFVAGSFRGALARRRFYYAALAATWVPLAFFLAGLPARGIGYVGGVRGPAYALTEARAICHYLRLAVWPAPLVFDYGTSLSPRDAGTWIAAAAVVAALAASLVALVRRPVWGFFGAGFFLLLAPSSSVVPVVGQPMAEHRMYLPLAVLISAAVCGLFLAAKGRRAALGAALAAVLAAASAEAALTVRRNAVYVSELSLWGDTASKSPGNARAWNNLGEAWMHAGDADAALAAFQRAVRLDGRYAEAHSNLAAALTRRGRLAEALEEAETAVRLEPDLAEAHYNLGNALRIEGDAAGARNEYEAALRIDPTDGQAWNNLGIAEAQSGRLDAAQRAFAAALRCDPALAQAEFNLGNVCRDEGRPADAAAHYRRALRIDPTYARAAESLKALQRTGAVPQFR